MDREYIREAYGEVLFDAFVELGRKKVTISEMLKWERGSVVKLAKTSGEPVDILIANKPLALGEAVVLDERFAVRITDILTKDMLIAKYKDGMYDI
ncbi:hypothetical protein RsTz2092_10290 [Deferribacterales bacterium RsTz2092]|nr:hypothetical protein AGMMS49941_09980 [Deferribacterales bacterium]